MIITINTCIRDYLYSLFFIAMVVMPSYAIASVNEMPVLDAFDAQRHIEIKKHDNQSIIIHLWATWCRPCIGELPKIERYMKQENQVNTTIYMIAFDYNKSQKYIDTFLKRYHITLPSYRAMPGIDYEALLGLERFVLPTTIRIDSHESAIYYGKQEWRN